MNRRIGIIRVGVAAAISLPAALSMLGPSIAEGAETGTVIVTENPARPVPADLRGDYDVAARLVAENQDDFSGVWIDEAGHRVQIGVTSPRGHAMLNAHANSTEPPQPTRVVVPKEKELPPSAESARAAAAVARVEAPRSAATLEQLQHDAIDMGAQFTEEDVWLSQADPEHDRVVISVVTASDELIAEMASRYGRSVAVHVDADRPVSLPQFGRQSDGSPFWGGAWIIGCTDAFTETYNGGYYMLTAGHCRPTGGTVSTPETSMGTVTQSSRENWNSGTGTVLMSGGGSTYRGDIAQIAMYSSKSGQGYIYRGSSSSTSGKPVRGMASQVVNGDPYCTGGSVSGEICGWTVRYPRTDHRYSNGELARNVAVSYSKQGWCTRPGDSGGPIYIVNSDGSVRARGIHSGGGGGGSDYYGGSLDQCFEVFTDIWDPYYAFPGTLLTS